MNDMNSPGSRTVPEIPSDAPFWQVALAKSPEKFGKCGPINIPRDFAMSAARRHVWKRSRENALVFVYRVHQPTIGIQAVPCYTVGSCRRTMPAQVSASGSEATLRSRGADALHTFGHTTRLPASYR